MSLVIYNNKYNKIIASAQLGKVEGRELFILCGSQTSGLEYVCGVYLSSTRPKGCVVLSDVADAVSTQP